MSSIITVPFQNRFTAQFPGEQQVDRRPRQTPGVLYSLAVPTPVAAPRLIGWTEEVAQVLGLEKPDTPEEVAVLGGNLVTESMNPYAACYGGHQFGAWAGQLGDGRAITLGELQGTDGKMYELQLKGAGPTAYSRRADGRAVLRSSVREYLMSEAMHHLGVPTTRALSLTATGEGVLRDMFYDGHPKDEPGAIVLRVAPSFLRFGSFELPAVRAELANLRALADWTVSEFYPHLQGEDRVLRFFSEVVDRTAFLISEWMRVGFVHGVMNTDNLSILGLTIDYGPFSMLDAYEPLFTPNTTDLPGRRYAFSRQPGVAYWNLSCLAGGLAPLFPDTKDLARELERFEVLFGGYYRDMMGRKLGLDAAGEGDIELLSDIETAMTRTAVDYTLFFLWLERMESLPQNAAAMVEYFGPVLYRTPDRGAADALYKAVRGWWERTEKNSDGREGARERMTAANPRFTLRNYLLHTAIEGLQKGDDAMFRQLEAAIRDPYSERFPELMERRPDWAAQQAGCSMLSCSS